MSNPEQIDKDLREYLEQEPNLRRDQRLEYLKAMFHKHFEISKLEHIMGNYDLYSVIHSAKDEFVKLKVPMQISKKPIDSSDLRHVAMIESFIIYLNKNHLLKKLVKFDYKE